MPRTNEQLEEIRFEKKKIIMESAMELFAEKGFTATSVSMIARHADISKGLLYNYFESKETLFSEILNLGLDRLFEGFDKNRDGFLTKEEFIYFLNESLDIIVIDIKFWRLYFMVIIKPETQKLLEPKIIEKVLPFLTVLSEYFERQGYENPMAMARLLGAILDGIGLNYMVDPENFPINEIKNIIISKFI